MARILVADDSLPFLRVVEDYLRSEGHTLILVMNGLEAMKHIHDGQGLDLVIADIHMPGMSGLELNDLFHKMNSSVPVIVMTAYPDEMVEEKAMRDGARGFLVKSFTKEELLAAVAAALK